MNIPTHLKHKPIIAVENYDRIDGPYADDTDAMGLSVGIAQWNTPGIPSYQQKCGATPEKSGHGNQKNYLFIVLSTWQRLSA